MSEDTGITIHAFIRPGTPSSAGPAVITQIVDLYNFGVISAGSKIWCNMDIPNALWVLSDISTFLRIVDVPTAGWVRLTRNSIAWGRIARDTSLNPSHGFSAADMPLPVQDHDTITVALRNTDPNRMRAQFGGTHHSMPNFEIARGMMRAIDLKHVGNFKREPLAEPSEFDVNHAGIRGLDLMSATTGPHMHRVIRQNIAAFTTTLLIEEFHKIQAAQNRIAQIAELITSPIVSSIAKLNDVGPFDDYDDEDHQVDEGDKEDEQPAAEHASV
jgi:hypothetical protein